MIEDFLREYQGAFIKTGFVILILFIIGLISNILIRKLGRRSGINEAELVLFVVMLQLVYFYLPYL
ncbi:hypothetical protein JCM19301_2092 [Jejuia pallidilutea]|uniref:Uncharacterized protein n=1 Tax=Jejuia pallidilutea TaxID=504487 RepID=A0A090WNU6_9FLAO|nr:hypothetical protein JCM19301_2092 [Jejuia pallidilutea]